MSSNTQIARLLRAELRHLRAADPHRAEQQLAVLRRAGGQSLHMDSNATSAPTALRRASSFPAPPRTTRSASSSSAPPRRALRPERGLLSRWRLRANERSARSRDQRLHPPGAAGRDGARPGRDRRGRHRLHRGHPEPAADQLAGRRDPAGAHDDGADHARAPPGLERAHRDGSQLSIVTYVHSATCGGAHSTTSIAAGSPTRAPPAPAPASRRSPTAPSPGPAVRSSQGSRAATSSPTRPDSTAPAYVGVTLAFPARRATTRSRSATAYALRNPAALDLMRPTRLTSELARTIRRTARQRGRDSRSSR